MDLGLTAIPAPYLSPLQKASSTYESREKAKTRQEGLQPLEPDRILIDLVAHLVLEDRNDQQNIV